MITASIITAWVLTLAAGILDNCIRGTSWVYAVLGGGALAAVLVLTWIAPWPV